MIVELAVVPADLWMTRLIGTNALHCLTLIPLMSIPPLIALIVAMRAGAPAHPALTGALAGAAAAGAAATIYATNCTDDLPLFVASWYPLATLIVVAAGALAGRKWLQWRDCRRDQRPLSPSGAGLCARPAGSARWLRPAGADARPTDPRPAPQTHLISGFKISSRSSIDSSPP